MWPDDRAHWHEHAGPAAWRVIRNRLSIYPVIVPPGADVGGDLNGLADAAVAEATATSGERNLPEFLADHREYARWLVQLGWRAALRRIIARPHLGPALGTLPALDRRTLLWLYQDSLTLRELAQMLQVMAVPHAQAVAAYQALVAALPLPPGQNPDDPVSFPVPVALFGAPA